jgi:8-oxo-dGTP pyrophosphatase MutT (NUDIX family)
MLSLLDSHLAFDEKERGDLRLMQAFATSLAQPFSRSQGPAHFTGSALITDAVGLRVVLVLHAKLNRWLQPGGHAEPSDGGDLRVTALREAQEETGLAVELIGGGPIDVDVHTIPARRDEPEHQHLDVRFLFRAVNPDALRHDPRESYGAQWVSWADAFERADEAPLRRLLAKARASTGSTT